MENTSSPSSDNIVNVYLCKRCKTQFHAKTTRQTCPQCCVIRSCPSCETEVNIKTAKCSKCKTVLHKGKEAKFENRRMEGANMKRNPGYAIDQLKSAAAYAYGAGYGVFIIAFKQGKSGKYMRHEIISEGLTEYDEEDAKRGGNPNWSLLRDAAVSTMHKDHHRFVRYDSAGISEDKPSPCAEAEGAECPREQTPPMMPQPLLLPMPQPLPQLMPRHLPPLMSQTLPPPMPQPLPLPPMPHPVPLPMSQHLPQPMPQPLQPLMPQHLPPPMPQSLLPLISQPTPPSNELIQIPSLLSTQTPDTQAEDTGTIEGESKQATEMGYPKAILRHRTKNKVTEYLTSWCDSDTYFSWQGADSFAEGCPVLTAYTTRKRKVRVNRGGRGVKKANKQ